MLTGPQFAVFSRLRALRKELSDAEGIPAGKFRNSGVLSLLERIIRSHEAAPGLGLPIGALTSQHFANSYLSGLDRLLLETCRVRGYVRYMDDSVWWTEDRLGAANALKVVRSWLKDQRRLTVEEPVHVGRARHGLDFCGFRIMPGRLLLSRRRKARCRALRRAGEEAFRGGRIAADVLQSSFAAALSLTVHADAAGWRHSELARRPLEPALAAL